MIAPEVPANEKARLYSLYSYSILDTLPEEDYDNLTKLASNICGTSISLVSLIDDKRQWFKSSHGLSATETPKKYAFCAHAINKPQEIFVVPDARKDDRFHDNPLVTGEPYVIFYAGVPLVNEDGYSLGTLCVIDHTPKNLSSHQIESLKALARQIMNLLELHRKKRLLEDTLQKLEQRNMELEQFAYIAAHDIKSPLNNIYGLASIFIDDHGKKIDNKGLRLIETIQLCAEKLKNLVDGLLKYSKSENNLKNGRTRISPERIMEELKKLLATSDTSSINLKTTLKELETNVTALEQVLLNLVNNAVKYNDKREAKIEIGMSASELHYEFYVQDNGPGIPADQHERIFQLFAVNAVHDRYGQQGNGIGLATVKKVVEAMQGKIKIDSQPGSGARFTFTFKR